MLQTSTPKPNNDCLEQTQAFISAYLSWRAESTWFQEILEANISNEDKSDCSLSGRKLNAAADKVTHKLLKILERPEKSDYSIMHTEFPLKFYEGDWARLMSKLRSKISTCLSKAQLLLKTMSKGRCFYRLERGEDYILSEGEYVLCDEQQEISDPLRKDKYDRFCVFPALVKYGNQNGRDCHTKTTISSMKIGVILKPKKNIFTAISKARQNDLSHQSQHVVHSHRRESGGVTESVREHDQHENSYNTGNEAGQLENDLDNTEHSEMHGSDGTTTTAVDRNSVAETTEIASTAGEMGQISTNTETGPNTELKQQ
jgi:hypothetical protein